MNFSTFLSANEKTAVDLAYKDTLKAKSVDVFEEDLTQVFHLFGGHTFDGGTLRIHSFWSSLFWTKICTNFFPNYENKIHCFAFDWMGRQYAKMNSEDLLFMLDPATGQTFELEVSLEAFFNEDLVEYKAATLATADFNELQHIHHFSLPFPMCISFVKPLFLGGDDKDIDNYQLADMEASWELDYQLFCKIKDLPANQLIDNLKIG